ncbi:MAG: 16S rRNA (adenine(1518)-N(6)/adenine(1519)-N(6))-dimethyltransferase RsmA [Thermodesulfobacteriota bacterium]
MNRAHIKKILAESELAPKKKLGQNFLVCQETVARIIELAQVKATDQVVELGVGLGSLTLPLARQVDKVIGLEVDRGIIRYHQEEQDLPGNVQLIHQDLLTHDFPELAATLGQRLKIIANLPYSISNPLLFKLLEIREHVDWAVLMLQKEVGQRLAARSGTKEYGILSVLFQGCSTIDNLLAVPASKFHPRPKVDSLVIKIDMRPPPYPDEVLPDPQLLTRLVKAGFGKRRKTLVNALTSSGLGLEKSLVQQAIGACGLDPRIRAEALEYGDFLRLSQQLASHLPTPS